MGHKLYLPKDPDPRDDLPEHPDAEYFFKHFLKYGVGILGERGLPDGGRFVALLPLVGVKLQPNIDLLYDLFTAGASGMNEVAREEREEREAKRKRK